MALSDQSKGALAAYRWSPHAAATLSRAFKIKSHGSVETLECFAPEPLGLRQVLVLKPGDVIPVRPRKRKAQMFVTTERAVKLEHLFHQQRPDHLSISRW